MIVLFCNETYSKMTKYENEDGDGDNDRNKDGNNNGNASPGSRSYGLIFDPIMMPWSRFGLTEDYWETWKRRCGCSALCIYASDYVSTL